MSVMAIFHLSVKAVGRATGRSATAAAAYRFAARINDERTGVVHDYTHKAGVVHRELVLPDDAPAWARERERLWNAAEIAETRRNSTVAREFEVALPRELAADERRRLACALASEIVARHRCAVDVAVHAPARRGDERNHHAHLLLTTRRLEPSGFTAKTRELDDLKTGAVRQWRERWATLVNERLAERGQAARIDHRSLIAQGIEREPGYHRGPAVTAMERRGARTYVTERIGQDLTGRLARAAELGHLERESKALALSIIDAAADLTGGRAERKQVQPRTLEEIRREAQAAWLHSRAAKLESAKRATPHEPGLDRSDDPANTARRARKQWLGRRDGAGPATSVPEPQDEKAKSRARTHRRDDDYTL